MDIQKFKFACGVISFGVIIFGTFGNLVSLYIWSKGPRCRTLPGAVYFIALAASDTLVLCLTATYYAVDFTFDVLLSDLSVFSCKLIFTTWHFTNLMSTYIVVCLTLESVVAICWPLQAARWSSNKQRTGLVLLVLFVVCFVLNLPWTVGNTVLPANSGQISIYGTPIRQTSDLNHTHNRSPGLRETTDENWTEAEKFTCQSDSSSFIFKYEPEYHKWFMDFCLLFSVPLLIITICNLIILTIICRRPSTLATQSTSGSGHKSRSMSNAMTLRVVTISVVYCVLIGPYSIAVLIPDFINNVNKNDAITCLYITFTCIWYMNNACNFLLYNIFGKTFRRDFKQLFYKRRDKSLTSSIVRSDSRMFETEQVSFVSYSSMASLRGTGTAKV